MCRGSFADDDVLAGRFIDPRVHVLKLAGAEVRKCAGGVLVTVPVTAVVRIVGLCDEFPDCGVVFVVAAVQ